MQGNQNRSWGPLMRSNCCFDSHSTTRRVSCKKGSISSAAWTQACRPPLLLLLLLRDVAGFRGWRGMTSSFWKVCGFTVHMKTGGLHFLIFLPWDPFSKKCVFRCCVFRIRVDSWPKWYNTCGFSPKSAPVWTAPESKTQAQSAAVLRRLASWPTELSNCWQLATSLKSQFSFTMEKPLSSSSNDVRLANLFCIV